MILQQELNREIKLSIKEHSQEPIQIHLNKSGLDTILQNIFLNSCEAVSEEIVLINIDISKRNNQIVIIISDNGEGISPENVIKCKEPFFTTRINGLGLGLSIVENLVLIMDGAIDIKSVLGDGTQIELIFPLEKLN